MNYRKLSASLLSIALSASAAAGSILPSVSISALAEESVSPRDVDLTQYGENLALGKTAVASSSEAESVRPALAVDGDTTSHSSRWGSNRGDGPDWIYVDLGQQSFVGAVRIFWENRKATSYKIQAASSAPSEEASWKDVKVFDDRPQATTDVIEFDEEVSARYIRLYIGSHTSEDPDGGIAWNTVSIYELEAYGRADENYQDPQTNVALNKTATASSIEDDAFPASKVVDGDLSSRSSRWSSASGEGPHWIYVDLGKEMDVQSLRIYWESHKANSYRFQTAPAGADVNDSSSWTDRKVIESYPSSLKDTISLEAPVKAQYVRLYIDSISEHDPEGTVPDWNTISIYEMEVYGGIPAANSANSVDEIADAITLAPVTADSTAITPIYPDYDTERFSVVYNGTDLEQIVDDELNIHKPLVAKSVKVSFKITNKETDAYAFKEITVNIPGQNTVRENAIDAPNILPPVQEWYGQTSGSYTLDASTHVYYTSEKFAYAAHALCDDYHEMTGQTIIALSIQPGTEDNAGSNSVIFTDSDDTALGEEGYYMNTTENGIRVSATHSTGAYWATRTILQGIHNSESGTLPCGEMRDYPTMELRGLIQDVGRKTFTLDYLQQLTKLMSWYKLNDFQVHLNDNYIQLEQYKDVNGEDRRLIDPYTAFRLESDIKEGGKDGLYQADLTAKDVYYTKEEFKDFIEESANMGITIVPEFDMPAHALSMVKVRPDLKTPDEDMSWVTTNGNRSPADHLDLKNQLDACMDFVKEIWNEYITGEDKVFDCPIIHIGADEYEAGSAAYRKYVNQMFDFAEENGYKARVWGSLSQLSTGDEVLGAKVNPDGTVTRRQINLWNFGWSNPKAMYDLGFELINCNDGQFYIVPNATYYYDYLGDDHLFNVNITSMNGFNVPAGDEQMLGGAFAIWNDMCDNAENGMSEYDIYRRTVRALGMLGTNLWGKGSMTAAEAKAILDQNPEAPGTNFNYTVDKNDEGAAASLNMDSASDASGLNNSLTLNGASFEKVDGRQALSLADGQTASAGSLETAGLNNSLRVKVKRTSDSTDEQILFESPYGAIKAVQTGTGKVGFTRENHDYSFDYELPTDQWVNLEFKNEFERISLYVNGELVDSIGSSSRNALKATMMFPVQTIGSETKPFIGYVDDIQLGSDDDFENTYPLDSRLTYLSYLDSDNALLAEGFTLTGKYSPTAEEIAAMSIRVEAEIERLSADVEYADYTRVESLEKLYPNKPSMFSEESIGQLDAAMNSVVEELPISQQAQVDRMADRIAKALLALEPVTDYDLTTISQSLMTASASSQETSSENTPASNAIDGNPATMFHTAWSSTTLPHWLQITFDTPQTFDEILYTPRSGGGNGTMTAYEVQVSDDGSTFTTIKSGTCANNAQTKSIELDSAVTTKYVRLVATAASNNNFSCSEINFKNSNPAADFAPLNAVIAQAEALVEADYPASSWTLMQKALRAAKEVGEGASAAHVLQTATDLAKAIANLAGQNDLDFTMLDYVVADMTDAKLEGTKNESALRQLLAQAASLKTTAYSQAQVDAFTKTIHSAWLNARFNPSSEKLNEIK